MKRKSKSEAIRKGRLVATLLSHSWRISDLPELEFSETELNEVTPLLYGSGAAALGWKRIAKSHLQNTASGELLHQAYRLLSLQAAIHEQQLTKVFRLLNSAGVDAILAKGWVAAQMYSDTTLRPYGDIDLLVHPEEVQRAEEVLAAPEASDCWIDLHSQFSEISERSFSELHKRSRVASLNGEPIRMLGAEDHLALLCLHFLRHGAWRPIWLCDIGAAVESVPSDFEWDVCLGQNKTRASWIAAAVALSNSLLNADTASFPLQAKTRLPDWFTENVLHQWSHPFAVDQAPMNHPAPISYLLKHPTGLIEGLRKRWPNAIVATISVNGKINRLPRLPYQFANCLTRVSQVAHR